MTNYLHLGENLIRFTISKAIDAESPIVIFGTNSIDVYFHSVLKKRVCHFASQNKSHISEKIEMQKQIFQQNAVNTTRSLTELK